MLTLLAWPAGRASPALTPCESCWRLEAQPPCRAPEPGLWSSWQRCASPCSVQLPARPGPCLRPGSCLRLGNPLVHLRCHEGQSQACLACTAAGLLACPDACGCWCCADGGRARRCHPRSLPAHPGGPLPPGGRPWGAPSALHLPAGLRLTSLQALCSPACAHSAQPAGRCTRRRVTLWRCQVWAHLGELSEHQASLISERFKYTDRQLQRAGSSPAGGQRRAQEPTSNEAAAAEPAAARSAHLCLACPGQPTGWLLCIPCHLALCAVSVLD